MAKKPNLLKPKPFKDLDKKESDFPLPVDDNGKEKSLKLDPKTVRAVTKAIADLLFRLPSINDEEEALLDATAEIGNSCRKSQSLPAVIEKMPALPGCDPILWRQIKQLPGYRVRPIREMGNDIFGAFPCFQAFHEKMEEQGADAHGEVLTISDFTHDKTTVNYMAKLIAEKGALLDMAQLDYGNRAPGYRPRIALFMTESWTFKLVSEKRKDGAPVDANFIYAWTGGTEFYNMKIAARPEPKIPLLQDEQRPR